LSNRRRKAKLADAMPPHDPRRTTAGSSAAARGDGPARAVAVRTQRLSLTAASALAICASVWLAAYVGWLPASHPALRWSQPWRRIQESQKRERLAHRERRLAAFDSENAALGRLPDSDRPRPVVFVGSSTIERMPLSTLFPARATLNRGVAAEPMGALIDDLSRSLPPFELAGVVVFAGRVELLESDRSSDEIAAALRRLLERIVEASRGAPLCLIGLPPSRAPSARERELLPQVNARIAELALEFDSAFVPLTRPPLVDANGALSESCSADELHLSDSGYAQLAQWLIAEGGAATRSLKP